MHDTSTLPEITSVEQARGVVTSLFNQLQQALWRVAQLEKQLVSDRKSLRAECEEKKEKVRSSGK